MAAYICLLVCLWSLACKFGFLSLFSPATKAKSLRRGVKEVVKAIRKGEKG